MQTKSCKLLSSFFAGYARLHTRDDFSAANAFSVIINGIEKVLKFGLVHKFRIVTKFKLAFESRKFKDFFGFLKVRYN